MVGMGGAQFGRYESGHTARQVWCAVRVGTALHASRGVASYGRYGAAQCEQAPPSMLAEGLPWRVEEVQASLSLIDSSLFADWLLMTF